MHGRCFALDVCLLALLANDGVRCFDGVFVDMKAHFFPPIARNTLTFGNLSALPVCRNPTCRFGSCLERFTSPLEWPKIVVLSKIASQLKKIRCVQSILGKCPYFECHGLFASGKRKQISQSWFDFDFRLQECIFAHVYSFVERIFQSIRWA